APLRPNQPWEIGLQHRYAVFPQHAFEAICAGVTAATDTDNPTDTFSDRVREHLVVVAGARDEIVIKWITAQTGEMVLPQPGRTPTLEDGNEFSNQRVRIAELARFVDRLDVAQLRHIHRVAQVRQSHQASLVSPPERSSATRP